MPNHKRAGDHRAQPATSSRSVRLRALPHVSPVSRWRVLRDDPASSWGLASVLWGKPADGHQRVG
jgi:hypothetical protein